MVDISVVCYAAGHAAVVLVFSMSSGGGHGCDRPPAGRYSTSFFVSAHDVLIFASEICTVLWWKIARAPFEPFESVWCTVSISTVCTVPPVLLQQFCVHLNYGRIAHGACRMGVHSPAQRVNTRELKVTHMIKYYRFQEQFIEQKLSSPHWFNAIQQYSQIRHLQALPEEGVGVGGQASIF